MSETSCRNAQMVEHTISSSHLFDHWTNTRNAWLEGKNPIRSCKKWWSPLTWYALSAGCMSKHHLAVCITNAIEVRNLVSKSCQWQPMVFEQRNVFLRKINNILIFHLHQSLSCAHQQEQNRAVLLHWSAKNQHKVKSH